MICRHVKGLTFTDVVSLELLLEVMSFDIAAAKQSKLWLLWLEGHK